MGQRSATRELTERWETADATAKLLHPQDVLLIAVLLHGSWVIENKPRRATAFIMSPSRATVHLAPSEAPLHRPLCRRLFHLCPIAGCSFYRTGAAEQGPPA